MKQDEIKKELLPESNQEVERCERCGKPYYKLETFEYSDEDPFYFYGGYVAAERLRPLHYIKYEEVFGKVLIDRFTYDCDLEELYGMYGFENVKNALIWDCMRYFSKCSTECKKCFGEKGSYKHYNEHAMFKTECFIDGLFRDFVYEEGWKNWNRFSDIK